MLNLEHLMIKIVDLFVEVNIYMIYLIVKIMLVFLEFFFVFLHMSRQAH